MTLLAIARSVGQKIGIGSPQIVAGSTRKTDVQLLDQMKEAAQKILDEHDWQALKRLQTYTGDGTTTAFDLPSDFYKMPMDQQIWLSRLLQPLTELSNDEWLDFEVRSAPFSYGSFTKLGGQHLIKPAMGTGETAQYYYKSNLLWNDGAGNIAEPMSDTDTFRLDDRLLMLGTVWSWKHARGLPYEQNFMEYQKALGHAMERDRGPRMVNIAGRPRYEDVKPAFPWNVAP